MSAFPSATWWFREPLRGKEVVNVLGEGEEGADVATLDEPKETDRRLDDCGSDSTPALGASTSMDLVHDRSSKPSPTSIRSAGGNCGLGGFGLGL